MRHFGLFGFPLRNEFSVAYFTRKFAETLIPADYRNFPVPHAAHILEVISRENLMGCNITIPHKQAIIPYCHELSEEAAAAGAVNTILVRDQHQLTGFNTDIPAFQQTLRQLIGTTPHLSALVLGDGGASRAVQFALLRMNIPFVVVSRHPAPGQWSYAQLGKAEIDHHRLIINTTPLGMFPDTDTSPEIPYALISPHHFIYDLVYLPETTTFMANCAARGAKTQNGLAMLHLQADLAFDIWQGNA